MPKISSGSSFLDEFLLGGYDEDIVTTIYGPSGSGKTNLCLLAAVKVAQQGKKILFIDTEGGIAVERIKQICSNTENEVEKVAVEEVLKKILFFNPLNFSDQREVFEQLKNFVSEQVGLIVVDSIAMLYRLELGKAEEVYEINSALGRQIALVVEIARKRKIPILVTNQVYSDFDNREQIKMVGGDLLRYGSKCLIELQRSNGLMRNLVLRKHRSQPEGKEIQFKIVNGGIERVK